MNKQPLPERKNIRWDRQDYSHPGEYMITVCTKDMKQILSKIVCVNERAIRESPLRLSNSHGYNQTKRANDDMTPRLSNSHGYNQTVGTGVPDRPHVQLTYYGKIADKYINQLNDFYSNINVIKYVIMPNHIHLLLQIPDNGQSRTPVPTGESCTNNNGANSTISKFISTFKRFCNKEYGENIWQSRFYDHVIRDENDYLGAINYIENNPYRWTIKVKS